MDIDEAMEKFGNSFRDAKRGPQAQAELFNMYGAALARAEAAEHRVAELEARLASATVRFIDGIGYLTLPEPVATSGAMHYGEPAAIE